MTGIPDFTATWWWADHRRVTAVLDATNTRRSDYTSLVPRWRLTLDQGFVRVTPAVYVPRGGPPMAYRVVHQAAWGRTALEALPRDYPLLTLVNSPTLDHRAEATTAMLWPEPLTPALRCAWPYPDEQFGDVLLHLLRLPAAQLRRAEYVYDIGGFDVLRDELPPEIVEPDQKQNEKSPSAPATSARASGGK